MSKPTFTTEFTIDSANLVINQGYFVNEACQAVASVKGLYAGG